MIMTFLNLLNSNIKIIIRIFKMYETPWIALLLLGLLLLTYPLSKIFCNFKLQAALNAWAKLVALVIQTWAILAIVLIFSGHYASVVQGYDILYATYAIGWGVWYCYGAFFEPLS